MATNVKHDQSESAEQSAIHVVLVPGYWLGGVAWDDVVAPLQQAGMLPHAVTLPGLGGGQTSGITLEDHIDAVVDLVKGLAGPVVLVGHSGGAVVVQGVVDRRPDLIRRIVYVDSGPMVDGVVLMPAAETDVELPSWEQLADQNCSIEGMDEAALSRFREMAVPHPVGVARSAVKLSDIRRFDVPASVICTSFGSEMLQQMIESGVIPSELGSVHDVHFVDMPTGHWPMFSRAAELAEIIRQEVLR